MPFENRFAATRSSPRGGSANDALALSLELERRQEFSRPFYDTGEHVLAGDIQVQFGTFRVGPNPGVVFSYGQIVAMGDLYETVDDMMNASLGELTRLKAMIV